MRLYYYILILLVSALLIYGCKSNYSEGTSADCKDKPSANVVKAIEKNCMKCHSSIFSDVNGICIRKDKIIDLVKSGAMPKGATISATDKNTIVNWK